MGNCTAILGAPAIDDSIGLNCMNRTTDFTIDNQTYFGISEIPSMESLFNASVDCDCISDEMGDTYFSANWSIPETLTLFSSAFENSEQECELRDSSTDWILGVTFSIASSVASCFGLIFQKMAHNRNQALPEDEKYKVILGIPCSPCWWASFLLMGLVPFPMDFFAYSFAAQSIVVPFAGMTLVLNQIFAPCILGEKLYRMDIYASILVFLGCLATTVSGSHEESSYTVCELMEFWKAPAFVAALVILLTVLALCLVLIMWTGKMASIKQNSDNPVSLEEEVKMSDTGMGVGANMRHSGGETPSESVSEEPIEVIVSGGASPASPSPGNPSGEMRHRGSSLNSPSSPEEFIAPTSPLSATAPEPSFSKKRSKRSDTNPSLFGFIVVSERAARVLTQFRPVFFACLAGGSGTLQNILFKGLGELMKNTLFDGGDNLAWQTFYPYLMLFWVLFFAINQLSWLNKGLALFDAVLMLPLYNAFYIVLSSAYGSLYYGEMDNYEAWQWVVFPIGILVTTIGVLMLTLKPTEEAHTTGNPHHGEDESQLREAQVDPGSPPVEVEMSSSQTNALAQV